MQGVWPSSFRSFMFPALHRQKLGYVHLYRRKACNPSHCRSAVPHRSAPMLVIVSSTIPLECQPQRQPQCQAPGMPRPRYSAFSQFVARLKSFLMVMMAFRPDSHSVGSPFYPWWSRSQPAHCRDKSTRLSERASTLSLLLPSFNKALRSGLHTAMYCACGCSRYDTARPPQVPSSQVTCSSPRDGF